MFKGLSQLDRIKKHIVTIGVDQHLSTSALYEYIYVLKISINYTNLLENAMTNRIIKLFLKWEWSTILRYLLTTVQYQLVHL